MKEICDLHMKISEDLSSLKDSVAKREDVVRVEEKVNSINSRINGSIEDIQNHIEHGVAWRIAIVGNAIMIVVTVALQIGVFLYLWGQLTKQVEINGSRIECLERIHPRN